MEANIIFASRRDIFGASKLVRVSAQQLLRKEKATTTSNDEEMRTKHKEFISLKNEEIKILFFFQRRDSIKNETKSVTMICIHQNDLDIPYCLIEFQYHVRICRFSY